MIGYSSDDIIGCISSVDLDRQVTSEELDCINITPFMNNDQSSMTTHIKVPSIQISNNNTNEEKIMMIPRGEPNDSAGVMLESVSQKGRDTCEDILFSNNVIDNTTHITGESVVMNVSKLSDSELSGVGGRMRLNMAEGSKMLNPVDTVVGNSSESYG